MTKVEILKLLIFIESVYTNFVTKDEVVLFWFEIGPYLDYEKVLVKVRCHIRQSPYPPTFVDLDDFKGELVMAPLFYAARENDIRVNIQDSRSAWMCEYSIR
ncbi:hypothetical protein ABES03_24060 [Neobacillus rhizosphaerae]|uniref:hypothetical protein n=1 Tax=Neobacillus rhizosphaerae TaxID=2880965 RepID=UPI003D2B5202